MTVDPSAPPVRPVGVRSRGGNAMQRTRAAVLDGAVRAVEKHGARRATMADIAMLAGIAKGTLYNHFRTKEAVYAATIDSSVRSIAEECTAVAREDLAEALSAAADRVGSHPALRRLAALEPGALAALVTITDDEPWPTVRAGIAEMLRAAGRRREPVAVDLVLRWLLSFVAAPGIGVDGQAALLAAALPTASEEAADASAAVHEPPAQGTYRR